MDTSRSLLHAWEEERAGAGSRTCRIRREDGHVRGTLESWAPLQLTFDGGARRVRGRRAAGAGALRGALGIRRCGGYPPGAGPASGGCGRSACGLPPAAGGAGVALPRRAPLPPVLLSLRPRR